MRIQATRRDCLRWGAGAALGLWLPAGVAAHDSASLNKWGAGRGYPQGREGGLFRDPAYRVGNYSGGYERTYAHRVLKASGTSQWAWRDAPVADFRYRWGLSRKSADEYMASWPTTGLLICRGDDILVERYGFSRTAQMRLTSWSMAKSVTSLLLGVCLDRGLIASYDDPAARYVPALEGTLHGSVTLRNLSNMSSGASISHEQDNQTIYPDAFMGPNASVLRTVAGWNRRREEQGRNYNYNELCALTLGLVIRTVGGGNLSEFAERQLWQPIGAQSDATWLTNAAGEEFNCIGFAATLRDWARLGRLVADRGRAGDRVVVSEGWIAELTRWTDAERYLRPGNAMRDAGYKAHMWHARADGSRPYFLGHHGQRVMIDMPTRTVLVHTAVEHEGNWPAELMAMLDAASSL